MNLTQSRLLIAVFCCCFSLISGCSSGGGGSSSSATDSGLDSQDLFYATMQDTTPVYALLSPVVSASRSAAAHYSPQAQAWGQVSLLYSLFFTLREYQFPRDEGVVDRSNLYKLLFDAESVLTEAYNSAQEPAAPVSIAAPFAGIDTSGSTFSKAANIENDSLSIAFDDTDAALSALITWKWGEDDNPDKAERGIAYYVRDKVTQDVSIDMVYSVDYDISTPETEYNLRCKAVGNSTDHTFEFNYLIGDTAIIAKGVSQGENNYVIFKYSGSGQGPYYLRVSADAGESFFKDLYEAGTEPITTPGELQDAQGYLTWIEAQTFMTESDLLTTTEDLNVGIEGFAGTINLVY